MLVVLACRMLSSRMELLHTNNRLLLANIPCYNMSPEKKNDTPFKV